MIYQVGIMYFVYVWCPNISIYLCIIYEIYKFKYIIMIFSKYNSLTIIFDKHRSYADDVGIGDIDPGVDGD